jgi:opacity protein-like surface antigen
MSHYLNKAKLVFRVALGSLITVIVMAAPPVFAQDVRTQALEQALKQMERQLQALRSELNQVKSDTAKEAQKVIAIEEKTIKIEEKANSTKEYTRTAQEKAEHAIEMADIIEKRMDRKSHMLFFRGGFAHSDHSRDGVGLTGTPDKNAWYVGAGFDWGLTKDVWGLAPKTSVASELMFEYKELGQNVQSTSTLGANVSQLTLTAAPKIKFLEGSRFRPWVIPAGLAIHVISPPSAAITELVPGVMFGGGVDYRIWKSFSVGLDARYHLTGGKNDNIKIDGVTAGGYLGIGF